MTTSHPNPTNPQHPPNSPAEDGVNFLKTATASPDYENLQLEGIPDSYSGPTFVKKDYVYTSVTVDAGTTKWLVMTPTAGVAYYEGVQAGSPDPTVTLSMFADGSTIGGIFPDAATLYPGCGAPAVAPDYRMPNTGEVVQGRILSHSAEIVCVNNAFNQYGTITTFKTPLTRIVAENQGVSTYEIGGGPALLKDPVSSEANVVPVREGSYSVAMSREADFNFYDVLDDVAQNSTYGFLQDDKIVDSRSGSVKGPAVLWDNGFDSIVFRVTVPQGVPAAQSFILKVWRVWELQPAASSLAHSISHASPACEPNTLRLYHEMSKNLPVSVPERDNPDFWNTVLDGVNATSGILAEMDMPLVSGIAKGVHAVTHLLDGITTRTRARRNARQRRRHNRQDARVDKRVNRRAARRRNRRR